MKYFLDSYLNKIFLYLNEWWRIEEVLQEELMNLKEITQQLNTWPNGQENEQIDGQMRRPENCRQCLAFGPGNLPNSSTIDNGLGQYSLSNSHFLKGHLLFGTPSMALLPVLHHRMGSLAARHPNSRASRWGAVSKSRRIPLTFLPKLQN
jgi:hypothetical protein